MIQVAFNNFGYTHLPEAAERSPPGVEGWVQAARDLGFSCFQYNVSGPQDPQRFAAIDMAALTRRLGRCEVTMSLHHHAFDLLTLYHFAERDSYAGEFCDFVKAALDFIHATGGDLVTIHPPQVNVTRDPNGGYADAEVRGRAAAAFRDALRDLGEYAAGLQMRLGIEAICFGDPFPGGTAFRGIDELEGFLCDADLPPSVGLQVDTTHFHHKGQSVPDVLRGWRHRLFDLHVSDSVVHNWIDAAAYRATFLDEVHLPIGRGTGDFRQIVATLNDLGYDDWLTLELYPQHVQSTADIVSSREALEALLAEAPPPSP